VLTLIFTVDEELYHEYYNHVSKNDLPYSKNMLRTPSSEKNSTQSNGRTLLGACGHLAMYTVKIRFCDSSQ